MNTASLNASRDAAARLESADRARRRAEADKIEALCDLAEAYNLDDEELLIDVLIDQKIRIGSSGTPLVSEMVSLEIGTLLGIPTLHAASELSAALDLKYRHPRLFEAVVNLEIEVDRALMMVSRCRDLHPMLLDEITAAWLKQQNKLTWTQAKRLVDKLVTQADPQLTSKKEATAREQRGVWVSGLNEGVMNLTGVLDILDARFLDARLTEVAGLIAPQYPTLTSSQRRAKAVGILANPAYALALLQEAAQPELLTDKTLDLLGKLLDGVPRDFSHPTTAPSETPDEHPDKHEDSDRFFDQWQLTDRDLQPRDPRTPPPAHHHGRAGDTPRRMLHPDGTPCAGLLSCLHEPTREDHAKARGEDSARPEASHNDCTCPDVPRTRRFDPHDCAGHHCGTIQVPVAKLRPTLGIAVHIHADALGQLDPAARIEKAGTITTTLLTELLGEGNGYNIRVQPVIDLPNLAPADTYAPSAQMRCGMVLAFPNEPFPFSQRDSAGLDLDHTIPYQPGRPGQTRVGNLAPLSRRVHRAKTAGYWIMHQPTPGRIEWRSPLGYRYDVTPFGTTRCQPIHHSHTDTQSSAVA